MAFTILDRLTVASNRMYKEEQLVNILQVERISQHEQERKKIKTTTQTALDEAIVCFDKTSCLDGNKRMRTTKEVLTLTSDVDYITYMILETW
jgi:hypothetical protein